MHDLNGTQSTSELELEAYKGSSFEFEDEVLEADFEEGYEDAFEEEFEELYEVDGGSPFSEEEEMELAAEFLEIASEEELDLFLGKVFRKAVRGAKRLYRRIPKSLRGRLRGLARKALPVAGGAIGGFVGGPLGAKIGSKLASGAGRMFGLELEGMSPEDQEFEVARSFVRLAGTAASTAARSPTSSNPDKTAEEALVSAARRYAPGLVQRRGASMRGARGAAPGARSSGRWLRRGNKIIILGV